jgi:hypothetical protein
MAEVVFEEQELELMRFGVQLLISNIDADLDKVLKDGYSIPYGTAEIRLERLRKRIEFRVAQLQNLENMLDAVDRKGAWPTWQDEVIECIHQAKYKAVENQNYPLACHWRDVADEFKKSQSVKS